MSSRLDPRVVAVYSRLWRYVLPHKLIGLVAVVAMAATAAVEATMVWLVEPLMDETLVEHNLETARWLPMAFIAIFIGRGLAGFATEASLGWIGRSVISDLRRDVFRKFLTLPSRFIETHSTGPILSRMTYNVEMVAESVTNVVTVMVRDLLTVLAAMGVMIYQSRRLFVFVMILLPIIAVLIRVLGKAFRRYSWNVIWRLLWNPDLVQFLFDREAWYSNDHLRDLHGDDGGAGRNLSHRRSDRWTCANVYLSVVEGRRRNAGFDRATSQVRDGNRSDTDRNGFSAVPRT